MQIMVMITREVGGQSFNARGDFQQSFGELVSLRFGNAHATISTGNPFRAAAFARGFCCYSGHFHTRNIAFGTRSPQCGFFGDLVLSTLTLDRVLTNAERLPSDEREILEDLLRKRRIETWRMETAAEFKNAAAFRSGKLKAQSAVNVIARLRKPL